MKKSDFTGWREVFAFTFQQSVKQKSYVIFIVVFAVIALLYSPVMTLFQQYQQIKEKKFAVEELVIFDESGLDIDYSDMFEDKKYKKVNIVANPTEDYETWKKQLEEGKNDVAMLVKIDYEEEKNTFHFLFVQGKNLSISELDKQTFADAFCEFFEQAKRKAVDITKEQSTFIEQEIERETKKLSETGEVVEKEEDEGISMTDYVVILALLMVCMLMITMSGNQIALAIVTEKSTRVLEYLVLNVRPLALIVGKLLAILVTSTIQMATVGFCYMASPMVGNMIVPTLSKWLFGAAYTAQEATVSTEESMAMTLQMIHGIRMEYVFLALLFLMLGIIMFGIIAGLSGASVSKMDEMTEAMTLFQALLIVGCYTDMFLCVFQITGKVNPNFVRFLSICPVTSPFLVPANLLLGKMSWGLIVTSFLVMLLVIALLFALTAKVYEAMIFYNGKTLKIKDILALAFPSAKLFMKKSTVVMQGEGEKDSEE